MRWSLVTWQRNDTTLTQHNINRCGHCADSNNTVASGSITTEMELKMGVIFLELMSHVKIRGNIFCDSGSFLIFFH